MTSAKYYWAIFLRRSPYFLIVATVITAAAVAVAMSLPPSYVSQMRLIVEAPQIPDELAASTAFTPAQAQLQIVEQRLLTRTNLLKIADSVGVFDGQDDMSPDRIFADMKSRTVFRRSSGNQAALMSISFEAPTGPKAAAVLNEYLTLIQKEDVQSRTGRAAQTLDFFQQEVARLNAELAERSARILSFKTANSDALPDTLNYRLDQQTLLQERLAQTERELVRLNDQRLRLIEVFESTGQVGSGGNIPLTPEQAQLDALRNELNAALAIYSRENPRIKLLEARIDQLQKVVSSQPKPDEEEVDATGNALFDLQLSDVTARQEDMEEQRKNTLARLEAINDTIARTPENAIRLDELELEYGNIQSQYTTAVDRLSLASTGERIEVMSRGQRISVIDPPAVPSRPAKPNRTLIAGAGGLAGIVGGLGLVVLLELLNRTIRRPQDLVSRLGVTPLASIPYIQTKGEAVRRSVFRLLRVLVILMGIPAIIYAIHVYYMPLDLITAQVLNKVGIRW